MDRFRIVVDRAQFLIQDGRASEISEMESTIDAQLDSVVKWAETHDVQLTITPSAGRRTKGKLYRIGYNDGAEEVLEALDLKLQHIITAPKAEAA